MDPIELWQAEAIDQASLPARPGCYVLVADPATVGELGLPAGSSPCPLYVGKAQDSISKRITDHLIEHRTGSSTVRRSIGALLRETLSLNPKPRSPKRTKRDAQNFRFDAPGEERLTAWITVNIRVCGVASDRPATTEDHLIGQFEPPLNLTGWPNPHAPLIKRKRKVCADLARTAAS